jgi:hypothetical protein
MYNLQFPTLKALNDCLQSLGIAYTEVNYRTLTIICECSEADIERAKKNFQATVTVIEN